MTRKITAFVTDFMKTLTKTIAYTKSYKYNIARKKKLIKYSIVSDRGDGLYSITICF